MDEFTAYAVHIASGSLREVRGSSGGLTIPHAWTDLGVSASAVSNGAQALHLAIALCVLNDTHREAQRLGVPILGVLVHADGDFDQDWASTGIEYCIEVDSTAPVELIDQLLASVDVVAEIPRALRAGAQVSRRGR